MKNKRAIKQFNALRKLGSEMRLAADGWNEDWKVLIATIMSAQTRDEITIPVAEKLFKKYNSLRKLANARTDDIENIISGVNYYRTKAKNISACCKNLILNYEGKIPYDINILLTLPGVGRKTANVFLAEVGKNAIGVDTHVNYISNYLGWSNSTNPHKTEEQLKHLFPEKMWSDLNWILVRFGKSYTSRKKKNEILDKIKEIS